MDVPRGAARDRRPGGRRHHHARVHDLSCGPHGSGGLSAALPWKKRIALSALALLAAGVASAATPATPRNFVYLGQDGLQQNLKILDRPDIAGAEVIYVWMNLEPRKGVYDFSMIEHDLA